MAILRGAWRLSLDLHFVEAFLSDIFGWPGRSVLNPVVWFLEVRRCHFVCRRGVLTWSVAPKSKHNPSPILWRGSFLWQVVCFKNSNNRQAVWVWMSGISVITGGWSLHVILSNFVFGNTNRKHKQVSDFDFPKHQWLSTYPKCYQVYPIHSWLKLVEPSFLMLHVIAQDPRQAVFLSRRVGTKGPRGERRKQHDRGDVQCSRVGTTAGCGYWPGVFKAFWVVENEWTLFTAGSKRLAPDNFFRGGCAIYI